MREHKAEPFGLMGGVRCAGCDETWPCEVTRLRAALQEIATLGEQGMQPSYSEWLDFHAKVALIARRALEHSADGGENG